MHVGDIIIDDNDSSATASMLQHDWKESRAPAASAFPMTPSARFAARSISPS
jgi:hypothetical protein